METEEIIMPTEEEKKTFFAHQHELYKWAFSLTQEQIDFICNGGWYNNAIKGYLIAAAKVADFTNEQTRALLDGLRWALSEKDKAEAEKVKFD